MPSVRQIVGWVAVGLVAVTNALPALPKMSPEMRRAYDFGVLARKDLEARQNPATGLPDGLTDIDILELYADVSSHLLCKLTVAQCSHVRKPRDRFLPAGFRKISRLRLYSIRPHKTKFGGPEVNRSNRADARHHLEQCHCWSRNGDSPAMYLQIWIYHCCGNGCNGGHFRERGSFCVSEIPLP